MTKKKPKPRKELIKMRGITATDSEWAWVCEQAEAEGRSASAYVRRLIQAAMEREREAG